MLYKGIFLMLRQLNNAEKCSAPFYGTFSKMIPSQTHRKKPFSAKQKKKQLQERRARKTEKSLQWDDKDSTENTATSIKPPTVKSPSAVNSKFIPPLNDKRDDITKDGTYDRIRSIFEKLTPERIESAKQRSMVPFIRLPQSSLETAFEQVYSLDTIIDFPKRPVWSYDLSKDELDAHETKYFDQWLHEIYQKYSVENLSWFEHNLEVWRQLWRVLEISDIILIIIDIRNPVLHFPPSLYNYVVNEMGRKLLAVFNKVDLVSENTLFAWRKYFEEQFPQLHLASFSCYPRDQKLINDTATYSLQNRMRRPRKRYYAATGISDLLNTCKDIKLEKNGVFIDWDTIIKECKSREDYTKSLNESLDEEWGDSDDDNSEKEEEEDQESLETQFNYAIDLIDETFPHKDFITLGLVGHPNVGKSSLINSIMGRTVVSTSRTPGHTKHFQTIHIAPNVRLCDSPGLVFPSLIPRSLQILSGMYPIAQVQEPYSAVGYLAERIPLESILKLKPPEGFENANDYQWSAFSICEAYALQRGFLTSKAGRPDVYRAANWILRFANDGRILLPFKPPGFFTSNKYEQLRVVEDDEREKLNRLKMKQREKSEKDEEPESEDEIIQPNIKIRTGGFFGLLGVIDDRSGDDVDEG